MLTIIINPFVKHTSIIPGAVTSSLTNWTVRIEANFPVATQDPEFISLSLGEPMVWTALSAEELSMQIARDRSADIKQMPGKHWLAKDLRTDGIDG
jgi:hypothetical protein